jgi:hypothetical protein
MWPFSKKPASSLDVHPLVAAALIVSALALFVSCGVMRWSWLLLDEQIRIRIEVMDLKNDQEQTKIQYEYWLNKLQAERAEGQEMNEVR